MSSQGGSVGVCLPRGVSAQGGVCPGVYLRHPLLLTESQTGVKTLPWPNFVAAGNNQVGKKS